MGQCSSSVAAGPALDGLVPTLRVGNRIEVRDPRALNLDAGGAYRINAERCGEGWAPPKPSNGPFWYCPRRGYWWPASVIATDRARGIKVHYDGYSSRWDAWISDSHIDCAEVRLACSSSGLEAPPADGCAVEVQLVQNAPFWAPGTVRGRSADGRVLVELSVDRSHRYFAPSNCDRVTVPLRMLRVVGAPTGSPTPTVALPAAIAVSGAGVSAVNGVYVRDGTYGGVPLYKNGQVWLLRYRLPAGMHFWYLADKDRLDVDDGDYYRIRSEEGVPPLDGSRWMLARDGRSPTPRFEPMAEAPTPVVGMPVVAPAQVVATEPPRAGAADAAPAQDILIGDCLMVRDSSDHEYTSEMFRWAVARVVATVCIPPIGPLVLLHCETDPGDWLMWLSPEHDADRLRPLSARYLYLGGTPLDLSDAGPHTEHSFARQVAQVQTRLLNGISTWRGRGKPTHAFRSLGTPSISLRLEDPRAWLSTQRMREPFTPARSLAFEKQLCRSMHRAVAAAPARAACAEWRNRAASRVAGAPAAAARPAASNRPAPATAPEVPRARVVASPAAAAARPEASSRPAPAAVNFEGRPAASNETPMAYQVSGAGTSGANGTYHRDGTFEGSAIFTNGNGPWRLLRFVRPEGCCWCVASLPDLSRIHNGNKLYCASGDGAMPPCNGWRTLAKGRPPAPVVAPARPREMLADVIVVQGVELAADEPTPTDAAQIVSGTLVPDVRGVFDAWLAA